MQRPASQWERIQPRDANCSAVIASVPISLLFVLMLSAGSLPAQDRSSKAEDPDAQPPRRLYLDEFRPQSTLETPLHPLEQAKFPCVNVHSHPGHLDQAGLKEMLAVMDHANIAISISLDGDFGNDFAEHYYRLMQLAPNRFVAFERIDYVGDGTRDDPETWKIHDPDYGTWMADKLSRVAKQGACGLKVWKDLGLMLRDADGKLIMPDDPRFDPVWARAGELGIPVLWHCADPIAFFTPTNARNERWEELYRHPEWSFYGDDFPTRDALLAARNRVIARHPNTVFICAHMGGRPEDLAGLGKELDAHPNMNVEIAARIAELGRQPYTARKFFLKYSDRILFGTDGVPPVTELIPHFQFLETWDEYFPYEDNPFPPQGFWNIYGIGLPDDELRKVYYENAARLIPTVAEKLKAYRHDDRASK